MFQDPYIKFCIEHQYKRAECCFNCLFCLSSSEIAEIGRLTSYYCIHRDNETAFEVKRNYSCNQFKDLEQIDGLEMIDNGGITR